MINKVRVTRKKQKDYITVEYDKAEVSKEKQIFDARFKKTSDQPMSRLLSDGFDKLCGHLMFASELIDHSIKLDSTLDGEKWFNELKHHEDERFNGVVVTGVDFIGNDDVIDSVKLYGYRETQLTEKPFKVKIETPVINLDRTAENAYPLTSLLDDHINDLHTSILAWRDKGETLTLAQQSMFVTDNA